MALKINLQSNINNASLQIGDIAYYASNLSPIGGIVNSEEDIKPIGKINGIGNSYIIINSPYPGGYPPPNAFIMFKKDSKANDNSLLGYYAEVKLSNNSPEKAELFALSSEITASSK